MPISAGTRLGAYEVLAPIGAGGMGEVYRARDTKLKRDVALKVLPERFALDPDRMARFQREAEVLASLNHPNIATIYGVEGDSLVMELAQGEEPKGPMAADEAWKIASQVAAGLDYAHERGIVHRDLKPANIKVAPDGTVKILDFGLAKAFSSPSGSSVAGVSVSMSPTLTIGATEVGMILGTAAYMSPEQARGKTVDKRADIWSFGVVLYELLTGERLFQGEDVTETLASVVKEQPNLERVPAKARPLLERCLQKDPKNRLRDIGDAASLWAGPPGGPAQIPAPPQFAKSPWIAAGVLLAATAALGWVHFREQPAVPLQVRFQMPPPDNGTIHFLAASPDGSKLAMSVQGTDGQYAAWIRPLDSVEARKLPGTGGATAVAWSPDGRYLAFNSMGSLKKVDVTGGVPETICAINGPFYGVAWNQRGMLVFSSGNSMNRVSAAGGEATPLLQLNSAQGDVGFAWPAFLPDGDRFLYFLLGGQETSGIYLGSLSVKPDRQDRRRLLSSEEGALYAPAAQGNLGYVLFLRADALMAQPFNPGSGQFAGDAVRVADSVGANGAYAGLFSPSATGILATSGVSNTSRQLAWFDRTGKLLSRAGDTAMRDEMALSPDGSQVAEGRADAQGSWVVWMLDLTRNVSSRLTFDNNGAGNATWSPDGRQIVYASGSGTSADILRKPSNGATKEEVLYRSDTPKTPLAWSPDGRWLLYAEIGKTTGPDLWALPDPGGPIGEARKPLPYLVTPFTERQARFSPDGKWVTYSSNENGTVEVYVRPFPDSAGGKWQVSSGGGRQARWRPDGKEIFYISPDGTLMSADVRTSGDAFQCSPPKVLFHTQILGGVGGAPNIAWRWDISHDGQRFLINSAVEEKTSEPVLVTTGWTAALRK